MAAPYFRDDTGAYTGLGRALTVIEGDANTLDWHTRLLAVEASLASGVSIESITVGDASFTLHLSDSSTQVIPLPVATFRSRGEWANSTSYLVNDIFSKRGYGFFLTLVDHTTDASPAAFDPAATDGTTENNPLYLQIGPAQDLSFDIVLSFPGTQVRADDALIFQMKAPRAFLIPADAPGAYAYLGTPTTGAGTDPTTISVSILLNGVEVGTIAFTAGDSDGAFTVADDVSVAAGDIVSFTTPRADDADAADLSITIPCERTDI